MKIFYTSQLSGVTFKSKQKHLWRAKHTTLTIESELWFHWAANWQKKTAQGAARSSNQEGGLHRATTNIQVEEGVDIHLSLD